MRSARLLPALALALAACGPAATGSGSAVVVPTAAPPVATSRPVAPLAAVVPTAPVASLQAPLDLIFGATPGYAKAVAALEVVIRSAKPPAEAWLYLGIAQARRGARPAALAAFERASQARPGWAAPKVAAVDLLRRAGDLKEARSLGERAVKEHPSDPLTRAAIAAVHRDARQYDAALRDLQAALAVDPRSAPALCGLGQLFLAKGDPAGALTVLDRALALQPKSADLHAAQGLARAARGDVAGAAAAYATALRLDPQHLGAHLALGGILVANLDFAGAEAHFRAARAGFPRELDAVLGLARARFGRKNMKGAAALYQEALTLAPASAHALYQLARVHGEYLEQPTVGLEYLKRYQAAGSKLVRDDKVAALKRNLEALAGRARRARPKEPPAPHQAAPGPAGGAPAPTVKGGNP